MATIGFIGLGNMGRPMARNLLKGGHRVLAYDVSAPALEAAAADGCARSGSLPEAVGEADVVVSIVPTGREVREVYLGARGAIAASRRDALLIDCSTIDVETAQAVAAEATAAGRAMLDAPVTGGVPGAEAGRLTFMCGGAEEAFRRARPILEAMGGAIVHAGANGLGQALKICNNLITGSTLAVLGESFALAEKLGLSVDTLYEALSSGSADSWVLRHMTPLARSGGNAPADRDYRPGFAAALMLKDLRLAQAAGQRGGSATPMSAAATALFALHVNAGGGGLDASSVVQLLRR